MFGSVDFDKFWDDSEYSSKEFCEPLPTATTIAEVEQELNVKLPKSYILFMSVKNGGVPVNDACPCSEPTTWASDHVAISSFLAIGKETSYSLLGQLGSKFMIEEWGYPDIGVAICDCPSAGHDMIFLDYRQCGRHMEHGEPQVVHVDQEDDYKITFLANNFEEFISKLVPQENFDIDEEEVTFKLLQDVKNSPLWPELKELVNKSSNPIAVNHWLRSIAKGAVQENGTLVPLDDQLSRRFFDIIMMIESESDTTVKLSEAPIKWSKIIAAGIDGCTDDDVLRSISAWMNKRISDGEIINNEKADELQLSNAYREYLQSQIAAVAASLPTDPDQLADFFIEDGRHRQIIEAFELLPKDQLTVDLLSLKAVAHNNVGEHKIAYELLSSIDDICTDEAKHAYRKGFALFFGAKHYCNSQALAAKQANCYFSLMLSALDLFKYAIANGSGPVVEQCKNFEKSIRFEVREFYGREAEELKSAYDPLSAFEKLASGRPA